MYQDDLCVINYLRMLCVYIFLPHPFWLLYNKIGRGGGGGGVCGKLGVWHCGHKASQRPLSLSLSVHFVPSV